jgi:hypothetical protein
VANAVQVRVGAFDACAKVHDRIACQIGFKHAVFSLPAPSNRVSWTLERFARKVTSMGKSTAMGLAAWIAGRRRR